MESTSTDEEAAAPPRRARRGNYPAGTARRVEIVYAAIDVFSTAGFHKGSLRDVADKVGISQAGVLHHFPSKAHLLEAVLAWRDEHAVSISGLESATGLDLLRGLIALVETNAGNRQLIELHTLLSAEGTAPDHPSHAYFVDRYRGAINAIAAAFAEVQRQGQLRPGVPPDSAARMLIALMDGLQVQWLLDQTSVDMTSEVRLFIQSLITVDF